MGAKKRKKTNSQGRSCNLQLFHGDEDPREYPFNWIKIVQRLFMKMFQISIETISEILVRFA